MSQLKTFMMERQKRRYREMGTNIKRSLFLAAIAIALISMPSKSPAEPFAYIAHNAPGNSLWVIDTATNTVVKTLPGLIGAGGAAVNPAGTRVYVTCGDGGYIQVIETTSHTTVKIVTVGDHLFGVAVNPAGTHVYVANNSDDSVSVIDTNTNTVIDTVTVGDGPVDVELYPADTRAYVTNIYDDTVSVIDTRANIVISTVTVGNNPRGVTVHPACISAYVANKSATSVSIIDITTNTVIDTITVGNLPYALGKFIRPPWDTDGDGLSDEWEINYFGNINEQPTGDYDGDGLTNLEEYQLLTDPTTPSTSPPIGGGGGGGCFIATATYGSALSNEVRVFKQFRDEYLLTHELGRSFITIYYKYSPKIAQKISKNPVLRSVTRIGLYPIVGITEWFLKTFKD